MRTRRRMATSVGIAAVLAVTVGAAGGRASPHRPRIQFAAGVPGDVRVLAQSTWDRFLDTFPARWACLPGVTLRAAWRLGTRAAYDPVERLVTVRIPGTVSTLRSEMVHEFAHHLEYTCPAQRLLRPRFLAAQGLARDAPWHRGGTWADIPAEQFAQATIQVVLGPQPDAFARVTPAALEAIRIWGH